MGVDAPQMNPQDLLAAQNAGGMDMAGLTQLGQGGLPPELVKQLQNQMGLGQ
jgi:hypothetical protein